MISLDLIGFAIIVAALVFLSYKLWPKASKAVPEAFEEAKQEIPAAAKDAVEKISTAVTSTTKRTSRKTTAKKRSR